MKQLAFIPLITILPLLGFSDERDLFPIYGLDYFPSSAIEPTSSTYYYVDRNILRDSPAWNAQEKFPLSLAAESRRASLLISMKVNLATNLIVRGIEILNIQFPTKVLTCDESTNQSANTNRWIVVFTFPSEHIGQFYSAVELLSGVFAEERTKPFGFASDYVDSELRPTKEQFYSSPERTLSYLEKLRSPDFAVPLIQWNPSQAEFPVDLENLANIGAARLISDYALTNSQLYLRDIKLDWFFPDNAIRKQNLDSATNLNHWFCTFHFKTVEDVRKYSVIILLDGTILQASEDK